ncbi:MAG: hypothetical protein JXB36_02975 [Gammaproteobacteria bacterium]|nr:hypothetical protein [Gammaproteobacteria bacterium]
MKLPVVDMSRWDIRAMKVDVRFHDERDTAIARVVLDAKDVRTGEPGPVIGTAYIPLQHVNERVGRILIKDMILRALVHEVDECLYIDGARLCDDPHPELKKP